MNTLASITSIGGGECCEPQQASSPSIISTLSRKKKQLESDLANVTAALDALEKNPDVAKVLELVARAR